MKPSKPILVHINRKHIARNRKEGLHIPVFSVRAPDAGILYAWSVRMTGSVTGLYQPESGTHAGRQPETPLSCGATAWLSVDGTVVLLDRDGNAFPGLTFDEAESYVCPPSIVAIEADPQGLLPSTPQQWLPSS